jgi:hypothetical protein
VTPAQLWETTWMMMMMMMMMVVVVVVDSMAGRARTSPCSARFRNRGTR